MSIAASQSRIGSVNAFSVLLAGSPFFFVEQRFQKPYIIRRVCPIKTSFYQAGDGISLLIGALNTILFLLNYTPFRIVT